MAVDSAHQIRVVVLPKSAQKNSEVSKIVQRELGAGWNVQRLTRGSRLFLLTGESAHRRHSRARARVARSSAGVVPQQAVPPG